MKRVEHILYERRARASTTSLFHRDLGARKARGKIPRRYEGSGERRPLWAVWFLPGFARVVRREAKGLGMWNERMHHYTHETRTETGQP